MTFKKIFLKDFSDGRHGIQRITETLRRPCEPMILLIGHFDGPTEVQLNSW